METNALTMYANIVKWLDLEKQISKQDFQENNTKDKFTKDKKRLEEEERKKEEEKMRINLTPDFFRAI